MTDPGSEPTPDEEVTNPDGAAEPAGAEESASAAEPSSDEQQAEGAARAAEVDAESDGDTEAAEDERSLEELLKERTSDLQRVQAEYVNYKRRVDRDRKLDHERAVGRVMTQLLPVLDDIERAREHGELNGGFKAVAESIEQVTKSFGLESFGSEGEPFDPMVHEALHMEHSEEAAEPSVSKVVQRGYRIGDGVVRPARVLVVAPEES